MQESYGQKTGPDCKRRKIQSTDVFISHAGPDKVTIARPLSIKLKAHGLNDFLDKVSMQPGDCGSDAMTNAMQSAKVGVFILSPEFAARKWTMRELRCFLRRRREAISCGRRPPILIPVFYRLSIRDCRELDPSQYRDIFEAEEFYSDERQSEASTDTVNRELKELTDITGIENDEGATNLVEDDFSPGTRERLVEKIFLKVKRAFEEDLRDVGTEGVHGAPEQEAERSGASGDARHHMRTTSAENDPRNQGFKASFQVPQNPEHVILKFGHSEDAPEERLRRIVLREGESQNVGAVGARRGKVVGTKGMGGIGKSCALRGLASDKEVCRRFFDGVYWLVLGQDAKKHEVVEQLARITRESGGETQAKAVREERALDSAVSRVREWFKGRRILLLIDDVWREATVGRNAMSRLREIADVKNGSRVAFTSREWGVVAGSEEIEFSPKEDGPSLEILLKSANIRREEVDGLRDQRERMLRFCGGLPLGLSVVGSEIATRREIAKGLSLKDVLDQYLKDLKAEPLLLLDEDADETYVYKNLSRAFKTSLDMMDRKMSRGDGQLMSYAEMYESLVVLQKQGWLPLSVLCLLWRQKGKAQARRVLHDFVKASLAERKDRVSNGENIAGVTLHDLQLDYVRKRCGDEGEKEWHGKLVQEWRWNENEKMRGAQPWVCGRKWKTDMAEDEYFRNNLCRHLKGAELNEDLWDVLSDPRWVAEKLTRAEGIRLQEDFNILTRVAEEDGERCEAGGRLWSLQKIAGQARLSAPFVLRNQREVWFQLYDGLLRFSNRSKVIEEFLRKIENVAEKPWLKSLTPDFSTPDALQDVILVDGFVVRVSGCAAKNEVTAWGRRDGHVFRQTFRDGKMEGNVSIQMEGGVYGRFPSNLRRGRVWSENGKYVALVAQKGAGVQVWDVHTGATADRVGRELMIAGWEKLRCWDLRGDGKRVALGRESGVVELWDVEGGMKIKEAANMCGDAVEKVSFSPDGKRLACVGSHGSILIMFAETGEVLWEKSFLSMVKRRYIMSRVSWSKNGKRVACTSHVGDVCWLLIFDAESDKLIRYGPLEPDNHELPSSSSDSRASCHTWSEDGTRLCCAEYNAERQPKPWVKLSVWDGGSGERISIFDMDIIRDFHGIDFQHGDHHRDKVENMSISRDGRWVAACGAAYISVWDTRNEAKVFFISQEVNGPQHLGWLEDGQRLLSANQSGKILIWRWDNLERVQEEEEVNKESVKSVRLVAWSSDDTCATASEYGDVAMYDVKTGKMMWEDVETHAGRVSCLEMSGDSKRVFTVARDGKVAMWNSKTGCKLWEGRAGAGGKGIAIWANHGTRALWSNDGTRVLVEVADFENRNDRLWLWDGKTGDKLWERSVTGEIREIAWSGNDTKIAFVVAGAERSVVVRSAGTGETIRVACGDGDWRAVLRRARTGETMGDAPKRDPDSVVQKWAVDHVLEHWSSDELADGNHEIHVKWFSFVNRPGEEGEEGELGWYADKSLTGKSVDAWNAWIERERNRKPTYLGLPSVKWSPDDKWIAYSGPEHEATYYRVMIWNWETGVTHRYQAGAVRFATVKVTLEWSSDGRRVAFGYGKRLGIWDIEIGAIIIQEGEGEEDLRQIAWFRDGSRIATVSGSDYMSGHKSRTLQILSVTNRGAVCEKQYHGVAHSEQRDLRHLIRTSGGELIADLERKLRIRREGDALYSAGDDKICLVSEAKGTHWHCSASGRHIAIWAGFRARVLYFYELVE